MPCQGASTLFGWQRGVPWRQWAVQNFYGRRLTKGKNERAEHEYRKIHGWLLHKVQQRMWQCKEKGGGRFFDSLVPGRRGGSCWITIHLLKASTSSLSPVFLGSVCLSHWPLKSITDTFGSLHFRRHIFIHFVSSQTKRLCLVSKFLSL